MAGKGDARRAGDDAAAYRKNLTEIKGFESSPDIERRFEMTFMNKEALENDRSGKYFIGEHSEDRS